MWGVPPGTKTVKPGKLAGDGVMNSRDNKTSPGRKVGSTCAKYFTILYPAVASTGGLGLCAALVGTDGKYRRYLWQSWRWSERVLSARSESPSSDGAQSRQSRISCCDTRRVRGLGRGKDLYCLVMGKGIEGEGEYLWARVCRGYVATVVRLICG